MTEGLNRNRWAHTASLMAHLANLNRDPKRPAYTAADFNPMVEEKKTDLPRMKGVSGLKALLGPNPRVTKVKGESMKVTKALLMVLGVSILGLCGCIPPPGGVGNGTPPTLSASPTPGIGALAPILEGLQGLETRLNQVQGAQTAQAGDLQNALAWGRAAHEASQKPVPSLIGTAVGAATGQPIGALVSELAGFAYVLAAFFFRKRT